MPWQPFGNGRNNWSAKLIRGLTAVSRETFSGLNAAFLKGMRELGHIEGNDFIVEWRSAEEHYERYPELIAELIASKVDDIVSASSPA